jgi:hypothetical protein
MEEVLMLQAFNRDRPYHEPLESSQSRQLGGGG